MYHSSQNGFGPIISPYSLVIERNTVGFRPHNNPTAPIVNDQYEPSVLIINMIC